MVPKDEEIEMHHGFEIRVEMVRESLWRASVGEDLPAEEGVSGGRGRHAFGTYSSKEAALSGGRTLIDWIRGQRATECFYCGAPINQAGAHIHAWIRHDYKLGSTGECGWNFHPQCFVKFGTPGGRARHVPYMRYEVLANDMVKSEGG